MENSVFHITTSPCQITECCAPTPTVVRVDQGTVIKAGLGILASGSACISVCTHTLGMLGVNSVPTKAAYCQDMPCQARQSIRVADLGNMSGILPVHLVFGSSTV